MSPDVEHFGDIAFTPSVQRHQLRRHSRDAYQEMSETPAPAGLGPAEAAFLAARDSFYLATVGEGGWPYVQHRGGPVGFLHVNDATHLAWSERPGNRQFVTAGNLDHDDRIALIAVDYPNRRRLKVLGHAVWDPDPDLEARAALGISGLVEGVVTVEVAAFDWNCAKFITPRYTAEQVREVTGALTARIADLEGEIARLSP
jgi:predicted pyridoxine 5'-phosphate oxidase superfamily flavin-nucleotide-binding protein